VPLDQQPLRDRPQVAGVGAAALTALTALTALAALTALTALAAGDHRIHRRATRHAAVRDRPDLPALDDLQLGPPGVAVHADSVPLPRGMSVQRVRQECARPVADEHREVVLDADAPAEHVLVADVAVVRLGLQVQPTEGRGRRQVERERVGGHARRPE
jgi:hypothetical protein